jgi:hypothetical protein
VAPRAGFATTALYFENLAGKARDDEDRKRWLEVAGFYRSLARIVSVAPPGFNTSKGAPRLTSAERWKARADECRALADHFNDPTCRAQMTRLAQGYDRMAISAE